MKGVSQNEGNAPTVTIGALNSLPFNQAPITVPGVAYGLICFLGDIKL